MTILDVTDMWIWLPDSLASSRSLNKTISSHCRLSTILSQHTVPTFFPKLLFTFKPPDNLEFFSWTKDSIFLSLVFSTFYFLREYLPPLEFLHVVWVISTIPVHSPGLCCLLLPCQGPSLAPTQKHPTGGSEHGPGILWLIPSTLNEALAHKSNNMK